MEDAARQTKAEYQLRDMKGEESDAAFFLIKTDSMRGQSGGPRGDGAPLSLRAPFRVVTAVLPNCFRMRQVTQVKWSTKSSSLIY